MGKELELKLRCVRPLEWDRLLEVLRCLEGVTLDGLASVSALQNTYYDSDDLVLHQRRVALRVRTKGEADNARYIQTLKTSGKSVAGISQRGEWEWALTRNCLDLALLKQVSVWEEAFSSLTLKPVFTTHFERKAQLIKYGGCTLELVLDRGMVETDLGSEHEQIHELELELVRADTGVSAVEVITALSMRLQSELPVEVFDESKAQRGYALYLRATTP